VRTLRRHEEEARQLSLAIGEDAAKGLAFRIAVKTDAAGRVERVVFQALRGDEGDAECFWQTPLEMPTEERPEGPPQLRLLPDDGYAGPRRQGAGAGTLARDTARRVRALRAGRGAGSRRGS
jgi:hypothetical protein